MSMNSKFEIDEKFNANNNNIFNSKISFNDLNQ